MCDRIFAPFCSPIVHWNWILEKGKLNNSYVQYVKLHSVQINYSMPDWRLIEAMSLKLTLRQQSLSGLITFNIFYWQLLNVHLPMNYTRFC